MVGVRPSPGRYSCRATGRLWYRLGAYRVRFVQSVHTNIARVARACARTRQSSCVVGADRGIQGGLAFLRHVELVRWLVGFVVGNCGNAGTTCETRCQVCANFQVDWRLSCVAAASAKTGWRRAASPAHGYRQQRARRRGGRLGGRMRFGPQRAAIIRGGRGALDGTGRQRKRPGGRNRPSFC